MTRIIQTVLFAVVALLNIDAFAYEYRQDDLIISNPWVYESGPDRRDAPVYMTIKNIGRYDDVLLSASTNIADRVELHGIQYENGVGYMRVIRNGMYIDAGRNTDLRADDYHLMLVHLKRPLNRGDEFYLKLSFKYAGTMTVRVVVETPRFYDRYYHYFYYFFDFDHRDRSRDNDWDRDRRNDDHRGRRGQDRDDHYSKDRKDQDHRDQGRPDRGPQGPGRDQGNQDHKGPGQIEQPRDNQQNRGPQGRGRDQGDQGHQGRGQIDQPRGDQPNRGSQGSGRDQGPGQIDQPRGDHQGGGQGQQGRGQSGKGQEQLPFEDQGKHKSKQD